MRVTTAFNRMLQIPGATVVSVEFTPTGVQIGLRLRARRLRCACGWSTWATYDRSVRKWRHLDLGACRLFLTAQIRRLYCRSCQRVVTEDVPWARPAARCTRDLEDVIAWMAQRVDKTTVSTLLRVSWETVAAVVRVVAEHIDDSRLDDLYRIGVDEVSYRKGHRYLTVVADHDRAGAVVWAGEGRGAATLEEFYDALGPPRCNQLEAVSLDMGTAYAKATRTKAPNAAQCVDPFHVVKLANEAIDTTRRWAWNQARAPGRRRTRTRTRGQRHRVPTPQAHPLGTAQRPRPAQGLPTRGPAQAPSRTTRALACLRAQRRTPRPLPPQRRPTRRRTPRRLARTRLQIPHPSNPELSRTIRRNREAIIAAVDLGLSNSKREGLNSKTRLINHRGYGHHTAAALIAMIYLCSGGITIKLPTQT